MSFKIIKTLSVSTDHITCKDYDLITEYIEFIIEYDRYIIIVEDAMKKSNFLTKNGASEGFSKSLLMAYVLGCERIEFSYDGEIIKQIPTYSK
tara:strand:- start:72 stop:350 length:279 start_codon:yes stop_codon:yes gene_type:complete